MSDSTCKGCGKRIIWGIMENGARVPMDPVPPVYEVVDKMEPNSSEIVRRCDRARFMVSHFATCPKANDFSRRQT